MVFLHGFNERLVVHDSYFGVVFDLLINFLFNVNVSNIKESLMIFGVK